MPLLRYGNNSTVELQFAEGVRFDEFGVPMKRPLADLRAAARAALDEPLNYPSLSRCTTPADHVVIALDPCVPGVADITAAVIEALVDAEVDPDGIAVLQTGPKRDVDSGEPLRLLSAALRKRVTLVRHDPADRKQLAYLAANEKGEAILINRALHEADVVLPIGCLHAEETSGYFGVHGSVFPAFSDGKTLQRFRGFAGLNGHGSHKRALAAEVDHVAWLLGLNFTIQVVPGPGGTVLDVLAGESNAVRQRGGQLYGDAWKCSAADRASLVVAAIEGDAAQQTWENLGRALDAADHFVDEGGAIALCCDLSTGPGPGLRRIAHATSPQAALRHVGQQRPVDALPAAQIARILERHKLYLLSRLDAAVVEELDIVPLNAADELVRLVSRHPSCILLSNAPYVTA